ncbi:sensor histidine kinase [Streptomyces poonensis]|uniref:Anti-sigma regulatory factor n=1 Tax=Streptomyces poonensis TaxID=68255 RepID=A0A918PRU2_9ACTN|nr:sensor histidine kinase [Streptomyces poonensis]GGZ20982.1 anti-sigma regulatory factor [Streptomyces poonensis]
MTEPRLPSPPGGAPPAHHLLLYGSDEQFLAAAVPFARDGLTAGEPVFIATTPHNTALLQDHLGARAEEAAFAPAHWYRTPAQALLAFHDQAHGIAGPTRVLGETPWAGLTGDQAREWTRYESLLTLALASTGAWHLCPYDTRVLPAGVLRTAQLTHPTLTSGADHRPNPAHVSPEDFSAACDTVPLPEPPRRCKEFRFSGPGQIAELRAFAARLARGAGLPADRIDRLLICVDEAAANAIRHGGGAGSCRIWTTAGKVFCEITDPEGTQNTALAGYLPPNTADLDGRGLWIIRQLSDAADMRTTHHGTTIRISISTSRSAPPGP